METLPAFARPKAQTLRESIAFGLVADTHFGLIKLETLPFSRAAQGNLQDVVTIFNQRNLGFAVHLGDVVHESGNRETTLEWLRAMDQTFARFQGSRHFVMGNHDLEDLSKAEFIEVTSDACQTPYYYFDRGGYRFIVLDPNYTRAGIPYDRGNFQWDDSWIPPSQITWLKEVLDGAKEPRLQVIVFSHQCLDESSTGHEVSNASTVRDIFERAGNVVAVFYGHRHGGGYCFINGIHYIGLVATVSGPGPAGAIVTLPGNGSLKIEGIGECQPSWGPFTIHP